MERVGQLGDMVEAVVEGLAVGADGSCLTRSSMPGSTGARLRASTIFRTVAVDTRLPCIAADTVAALRPAAVARSQPSHPRRASSNLSRLLWTRVLATPHCSIPAHFDGLIRFTIVGTL